MTRFREWVNRLCGSLGLGRTDRDLEAEVRAHLELAAEEETRRGALSPEAARRAASVRAGGAATAVDALRDQRGVPWLEDLLQDLRFGARGVRRSPVGTAVIVLCLALGIGANTALFSLTEATVLRELPVGTPEELVFLRWHSRRWFPDMERFAGSGSVRGFRRSPTFTTATFAALETQNRTLSEVFAFGQVMDTTAAVGRQAHPATLQIVSGMYFNGLRIRPAIGRGLTAADDTASAEPVAVISDPFWARRFGRDPAAIGSQVVLEGAPFTIVGVAPGPFRGAVALAPRRPDVWVPLAFAPRFLSRAAEPGYWWLSVMGRRRRGVNADQVRGNLEGVFRAAVLTTETPSSDDLPQLDVLSARRGARDEGPDDAVEHAVLLGVIFGSLLLVVCVNVASLLLARLAVRRAEIGVRLALGAGRGRLVRQMLTENVALGLAGGLLGLALAYWGRALFSASGWVPPDLDLHLSPGVIGLTAILSATTGLLFGLAPVLRATRTRSGGLADRLQTDATSRSRASRTLLMIQVATAVILLVGAGLFARTLGQWNTIQTGFDADDLLVFQINPGALGYDSAHAAILRDRLVARIRAVPGVVACTTSGPFWRSTWSGRLFIDGEPRRRGDGAIPRWLPVRHDFFRTLGVPLLAGRGFRPDEDQRPSDVAVVDENFARQHFGRVSPIGHRIAFQAGGREFEIVGIVGNMRLPGTRPEDVMPAVFLPERTRRADLDPEGARRRDGRQEAELASFEIRTATDPTAILPAIRAAVGEIDPALPIEDPTTVARRTREILAPTRIVSLIWLSFGSVALALTAMGLYGLVASAVAQRTREIGIRTALGARRLDIVRLVTAHTLHPVALGIAAGLAGSMAVNQLARAYIFGVTFYDPLTLLAVVLVLGAVTGIAALLPTRRALRVDPATALRWE